ncbi:MAG TPA: hypothetical protein VN811_06245, partial [Thermoanaerobaculia bacterium]|nr:hypothetical protein [Thermoanaerobaculia bacterium]
RDAGNALWDIRGRLFRRDGTPVTGAIRLNQDRLLEQELPRISFAPNGTLITGWHSVSPRQGGPVARRFAASPGEEICAAWGGKLRCHLGRVGGAMQVLATIRRGGDVPLLGDVDGDGRDDVCSYRAGRFSCDVAHAGAVDWSVRFGFAGDVPLLGDVDGDGKADPCVRRRTFLVCDARHDGSESVRQDFGHGGETPRLGDMDGDGRADLCLIEGAYWSCGLSADRTRLTVVFQQPGGSPALGDVDRDGKADPCLLRKGLLTCATHRDGSAPDYRLRLEAPAGAGLLFGNLDGL